MEKSESTHLKGRILLWADLSYDDTDTVNKAQSIPEIERILCDALNIEDSEPRRGILLELYTNTVLFCREQKFNTEQTSVLLSIIKNVHQLNAETPLNNMDQCFTYCSELLLVHSVRRPPFSIDLFNLEEVTKILKYFINTYMRHYMLYKYIFTPQMYLDLSLSYNGLHEEPAAEEPASSEEEQDNEKEAHAANKEGIVGTETLPTETDEPKQDSSPKATLRRIIQKEVKEEVMRLTAQLEKRLQETTDQLNTAFAALEIKLQTKK
ncbi:coiled-coil domain-containing protein 189 [Trichomycterus rosablanca]|uniref:coiled-coil domain-containing protein 189 n=1 Tax=Trichomycterus rosablanca TaxID=2290929 RepID=UPI002F35929A